MNISVPSLSFEKSIHLCNPSQLQFLQNEMSKKILECNMYSMGKHCFVNFCFRYVCLYVDTGSQLPS